MHNTWGQFCPIFIFGFLFRFCYGTWHCTICTFGTVIYFCPKSFVLVNSIKYANILLDLYSSHKHTHTDSLFFTSRKSTYVHIDNFWKLWFSYESFDIVFVIVFCNLIYILWKLIRWTASWFLVGTNKSQKKKERHAWNWTVLAGFHGRISKRVIYYCVCFLFWSALSQLEMLKLNILSCWFLINF